MYNESNKIKHKQLTSNNKNNLQQPKQSSPRHIFCCFTSIDFLVPCDCFVSLPDGAVGCPAALLLLLMLLLLFWVVAAAEAATVTAAAATVVRLPLIAQRVVRPQFEKKCNETQHTAS